MKNNIFILVSISFLALLLFLFIHFYFQESLKNNVKKRVFDECFNYYSSQGVGSDDALVNVCFDKADSIFDK